LDIVPWFSYPGINVKSSGITFRLHTEDGAAGEVRTIHDNPTTTALSTCTILNLLNPEISPAPTYGVQLLRLDSCNKAGNVRITYTDASSRNHCCRVKAISITHSQCVSVALLIQHATRMRRTIYLSEACFAQPYCPTLSHKR
jgi:hypothetical protein